MVALLDVVRLTRDVPEEGLRRGDRGTVVEVFDTPERAYEVEFVDAAGRTTALLTLLPEQVEVVGGGGAAPSATKPAKRAATVTH